MLVLVLVLEPVLELVLELVLMCALLPRHVMSRRAASDGARMRRELRDVVFAEPGGLGLELHAQQ